MSKDIEVNIQCDYLISKETYFKVLEGLLKYVLYQCHQIPVQVEVLQREDQNWKRNSQSKNVCSQQSKDNEIVTNSFSNSMNAREEIKERLCQRRKEQIIRNYEKKRRSWLLKVDNFLTCYNAAIMMLQEELDKSIVSSVVFIIGNSPSLANVVFKIYINSCSPNHVLPYHNKKRNSNTCYGNNFHGESLERKIFLGLFRAFAANDELTKFINGHFATTKVWLLLHKQPNNLDIKDKEDTSKINCDLIPQMEFKIPRRAKVINIVLNELQTFCNNEIVDMELTPCIDSDVMHTSNISTVQVNNFGDRKRIKISLFPSVHNVFDRSSNNNTSCDKLGFNICNDNPEFETRENRESMKLISSNKVSDSAGMRFLENTNLISSQNILCQYNYRDNIDKTHISSGEVSHNPIKLLSQTVDSLHVDEDHSQFDELVWYRYPICMQGFKDVYLQN